MASNSWGQRLRRLSFSTGIVTVVTLVSGGVLAAPDGGGAPYPDSTFLPNMELDWSTLDRKAPGSDLWPMTWADDGSVYTMWGDGGGFGDDADKEVYVSIGLARLRGEKAKAITGENLIGGMSPKVAPCFATAGGKAEMRDQPNGRTPCKGKGLHGKSASLMALDGDLYAFIAPGSGLAHYEETRLFKARAGSNNWRRADWAFDPKSAADGKLLMPGFLQAGRGQRELRDYVYAYSARFQPRSLASGLDLQDGPGGGEIALLRAPRKADLMDRTSWSYFAGLGKDDSPQWTADPKQLVPTITDKNGVGWTTSATYVKSLKRYLVATEHGRHGSSSITLLESPNPWGPWKTVAYKQLADPQGRVETRNFFFNFAPQAFSAGGKDFTLAMTGGGNADALLMVDGSFETGKDDGEAQPDTPVTEALSEEEVAAAEAALDRAKASRLRHRAALVDGVELNRWTQTRRQQEVEEGRAAALAALPEDAQLGLSAFAVGSAGLPESEDAELAQGEVGRAQFTQAFADDAGDGGAGVTYRLSEGTSVGIAITSYSDTTSSDAGDIAASSHLASRGATAFLQHEVGMLELETRFAYSHDQHEQVERDELFGGQDRVSFKGRSMELAQRLGVPVRRGGMVVTPWAELGYESQAVDGFSVGEGATEQTYGDVEVSDMLASFGIDTRLEPVALGQRAQLTLRGGLSYTQGLSQDDYRLEVQQAGLGSQQETIERPAIQTVGLTLGGTLGLGQALALDAGVLLQHDLETGASQSARVGLSWQF